MIETLQASNEWSSRMAQISSMWVVWTSGKWSRLGLGAIFDFKLELGRKRLGNLEMQCLPGFVGWQSCLWVSNRGGLLHRAFGRREVQWHRCLLPNSNSVHSGKRDHFLVYSKIIGCYLSALPCVRNGHGGLSINLIWLSASDGPANTMFPHTQLRPNEHFLFARVSGWVRHVAAKWFGCALNHLHVVLSSAECLAW